MNTKTQNYTNEHIHFIHDQTYNLLVAGGTELRRRNTSIGFVVDEVTDEGVVVTVADAVHRDSVDSYNRGRARSIIRHRINMSKDDPRARRRYTFMIKGVTEVPTTFNGWRDLEHRVINAVQFHNNARENGNIATFLGGHEVQNNIMWPTSVANQNMADSREAVNPS